MVGASADERALSTAMFSVRRRLPWLHINLLTAFLAAAVVGFFESLIAQFTALAVLLPVVAGQSGNAGSQALAVTMRGSGASRNRYSRMASGACERSCGWPGRRCGTRRHLWFICFRLESVRRPRDRDRGRDGHVDGGGGNFGRFGPHHPYSSRPGPGHGIVNHPDDRDRCRRVYFLPGYRDAAGSLVVTQPADAASLTHRPGR